MQNSFSRFETAAQVGETVGDIVYRRLRADIVNGRLRPNEKLKLETLRSVYDVSVTTLRELLNRLAVDELVSAEGQRGFRVAPISAAELQELADLRILLETTALRRSIANGDLDWQAAVIAAHYKLSMTEKALIGGEGGAVDQWVMHDWGFHNATIAACATGVLVNTHASVFDRFSRYHMLALNFRGEAVAKDHAALRDLVVAREADAAVALLTRHIQSGVDHLLASGSLF